MAVGVARSVGVGWGEGVKVGGRMSMGCKTAVVGTIATAATVGNVTCMGMGKQPESHSHNHPQTSQRFVFVFPIDNLLLDHDCNVASGNFQPLAVAR